MLLTNPENLMALALVFLVMLSAQVTRVMMGLASWRPAFWQLSGRWTSCGKPISGARPLYLTQLSWALQREST